MPQLLAPLAAQTSFSTMAVDYSAHLRGCPTPVIAAAVKRVVTDLCDRAHVWREYGEEITLVAGTYEYTLVPTTLTGEVNDVISATTTVDSTTHAIYYQQLAYVQRVYPSWPSDADGDAQVFSKPLLDTIWLAPVPDTAGVMTPYVSLRPTPAATEWPASLASKFNRVVLHGALHDLMLMPERPWSNDKLALYHGKQWTYLLNSARVAAERGFNTSDVSVQMIPMA